MPAEFTLPFSGLNGILPTVTLEDVTIEVPTLGEIRREIREQTLGRTEVDDIVRDALDDAELTAAGGGITVDVDGVFGPLADDIAEGLREALEDPLDVDQFVDDVVRGVEEAIDLPEVDLPDDLGGQLQGLSDDLDGLADQFDALDIPNVTEVRTAVSEETTAVLEDVLPDWVTLDLTEAASRLVETGLEEAVSQDTKDRLQDLTEDS
jgi:hypothetical protein